MELTPFEAFVNAVFAFLIGMVNTVFDFCLTVFLLWAIFYIVGRFFVCQNKREEFSELCEMTRAIFRDALVSLKEVMSAVKEEAKFWAEEKFYEIKQRREIRRQARR